MFSAKEAYEKVHEKKTAKLDNQLLTIEGYIDEAIEQEKMEVEIPNFEIFPENAEFLRGKGYAVATYGSFEDEKGIITLIGWDPKTKNPLLAEKFEIMKRENAEVTLVRIIGNELNRNKRENA